MLLEIEKGKQSPVSLNFPLPSRFNARALAERTAFYGLLLTIFLTAIPYGTVDPWFKSLFVFLVCILAVFRIFLSISSGKRTELFADRLFFAPLLGILLLAVIQTIPFRNAVISLDVFETKNFILVFAGLILTGEILLQYAATEKRLRNLIYLVLIIGIGSAAFGLLRQQIPVESFFSADVLGENVQYAQFVNRNHFAFLMEMTLGLLIGLLLRAKFPKWLKPVFWVMIALICLSIILTNSRGGILSAAGIVLIAVFIYFLTGKKNPHSTAGKSLFSDINGGSRLKTILVALSFMALLFGIAVFTVAFVGGDSAAGRLEDIQSEIQDDKSTKLQRLDIWQATWGLIKDNPIVGIGFGAYPSAITKYDTAPGKMSLQQAHNDYLEVAAAGGLTAVLLMLFFIIIVVKRIQKQFFSPNKFRRASCFGAVLGICGVLLHSVTDFGLHVLVNALVFTILVVIATADIDRSGEITVAGAS